MLAARRARLLPESKDAAVEAVKGLTINWINMHLTDGSAKEVVAAVRKADRGRYRPAYDDDGERV
jgi:hypothetical protein